MNYDNRPFKRVVSTARKPYVQTPVPRGTTTPSTGNTRIDNFAVSSTVATKAPKGELKRVDIWSDWNVADIDESTGVPFILLNGVQSGSGTYQRLGRKITMKSLELRALWRLNNNSGQPDVWNGKDWPEYSVRIMVVYDKEVDGTTFPPIADLLQDLNQAGTQSTYPLSFPNLYQSERFLILRDWTFFMPSGTGANVNGWLNNSQAASTTDHSISINKQAGLPGVDNIHDYIKLNKLQTSFKSTNDPVTTGDIASGGLYIFGWSTLDLAGEYQHPLIFKFDARLKYYDD